MLHEYAAESQLFRQSPTHPRTVAAKKCAISADCLFASRALLLIGIADRMSGQVRRCKSEAFAPYDRQEVLPRRPYADAVGVVLLLRHELHGVGDTWPARRADRQ